MRCGGKPLVCRPLSDPIRGSKAHPCGAPRGWHFCLVGDASDRYLDEIHSETQQWEAGLHWFLPAVLCLMLNPFSSLTGLSLLLLLLGLKP